MALQVENTQLNPTEQQESKWKKRMCSCIVISGDNTISTRPSSGRKNTCAWPSSRRVCYTVNEPSSGLWELPSRACNQSTRIVKVKRYQTREREKSQEKGTDDEGDLNSKPWSGRVQRRIEAWAGCVPSSHCSLVVRAFH